MSVNQRCLRFALFYLALFSPLFLIAEDKTDLRSIHTPFGSEYNLSGVIKELLQSKTMERLRGVDQSGIVRYTMGLPTYWRYDHCVGVYMLLQRYGASTDECIAGLLHDASHTVFSHVGDFLFSDGDKEKSYQDHIHLWSLSNQDCKSILAKYNLTLEEVDPEKEAFSRLEQTLPDMCADRIEYNLHTAYLFGLMSQEDVNAILNDLCYKSNKWFFQNKESAKRFGELSLHFTETLWAEPIDLLTEYWTAQALKEALNTNEISLEEIYFSTDATVLSKLLASTNPKVALYVNCAYHPLEHFTFVAPEEANLVLKGKFRGIDPLVLHEGVLVRLTSLDEEFARRYTGLQKKLDIPYYIFVNVNSEDNTSLELN